MDKVRFNIWIWGPALCQLGPGSWNRYHRQQNFLSSFLSVLPLISKTKITLQTLTDIISDGRHLWPAKTFKECSDQLRHRPLILLIQYESKRLLNCSCRATWVTWLCPCNHCVLQKPTYVTNLWLLLYIAVVKMSVRVQHFEMIINNGNKKPLVRTGLNEEEGV